MMFKVDPLVLITGSDILITDYGVKIHQPTISEIALIGEEKFFSILNIFVMDINDIKKTLFNLSEVDNENLTMINSLELFDIILLLMNSDESSKQLYINFFNLILNNYSFEINEETLKVSLKDNDNIIEVDYNLFNIIKDIISQIFIFNKFFNTTSQHNPINDKAYEISQKLKKTKERVNAQKKEHESKSIFSNIISILGIIGYGIKDLNNLTIYQLYNQFERYTLYMSYDQGMKAALAGAKVDIVDWFKEI